jgi:hypothetical protein
MNASSSSEPGRATSPAAPGRRVFEILIALCRELDGLGLSPEGRRTCLEAALQLRRELAPAPGSVVSVPSDGVGPRIDIDAHGCR